METRVKAVKRRAIKLNARVKRDGGANEKAAVKLEAEVKKILFTRSEQSDGGFLINYYYVRTKNGALVPEDVRSATHYERVYYDRDGKVLGSMIGELGGKVLW